MSWQHENFELELYPGGEKYSRHLQNPFPHNPWEVNILWGIAFQNIDKGATKLWLLCNIM